MLTAERIRSEINELVEHGDNRADISTLADLYVCLNAMSETPPGLTGKIKYNSDSEFSQAIQGKDWNEVLSIMDEAMSALETLMPKLYSGIMRKLTD